jgi:hypothetical protein
MRSFPSEKALVTAYWRKLTRSIGNGYGGRGRAFARPAVRALQTGRGRTRGIGALKEISARQAGH